MYNNNEKKNIVNNKNYLTELNANKKNVYKIRMEICYAKITVFWIVNEFQTKKIFMRLIY